MPAMIPLEQQDIYLHLRNNGIIWQPQCAGFDHRIKPWQFKKRFCSQLNRKWLTLGCFILLQCDVRNNFLTPNSTDFQILHIAKMLIRNIHFWLNSANAQMSHWVTKSSIGGFCPRLTNEGFKNFPPKVSTGCSVLAVGYFEITTKNEVLNCGKIWCPLTLKLLKKCRVRHHLRVDPQRINIHPSFSSLHDFGFNMLLSWRVVLHILCDPPCGLIIMKRECRFRMGALLLSLGLLPLISGLPKMWHCWKYKVILQWLSHYPSYLYQE